MAQPIRLGSRCHVPSFGDGTVCFVGQTSFSHSLWVGVSLDEARGKNDGSVFGKRYFDADPNYGVFVRPSQVRILSLPEEQEPEQQEQEQQQQQQQQQHDVERYDEEHAEAEYAQDEYDDDDEEEEEGEQHVYGDPRYQRPTSNASSGAARSTLSAPMSRNRTSQQQLTPSQPPSRASTSAAVRPRLPNTASGVASPAVASAARTARGNLRPAAGGAIATSTRSSPVKPPAVGSAAVGARSPVKPAVGGTGSRVSSPLKRPGGTAVTAGSTRTGAAVATPQGGSTSRLARPVAPGSSTTTTTAAAAASRTRLGTTTPGATPRTTAGGVATTAAAAARARTNELRAGQTVPGRAPDTASARAGLRPVMRTRPSMAPNAAASTTTPRATTTTTTTTSAASAARAVAPRSRTGLAAAPPGSARTRTPGAGLPSSVASRSSSAVGTQSARARIGGGVARGAPHAAAAAAGAVARARGLAPGRRVEAEEQEEEERDGEGVEGYDLDADEGEEALLDGSLEEEEADARADGLSVPSLGDDDEGHEAGQNEERRDADDAPDEEDGDDEAAAAAGAAEPRDASSSNDSPSVRRAEERLRNRRADHMSLTSSSPSSKRTVGVPRASLSGSTATATLTPSRRAGAGGAGGAGEATTEPGGLSAAEAGQLQRELDEARAHLRLLERKRDEERERVRESERAREEAESSAAQHRRLLQRHAELQDEARSLRATERELGAQRDDAERQLAEAQDQLEIATLDREVAEEKAEAYKEELDELRDRLEEMRIEVEVLRTENAIYEEEGKAAAEGEGDDEAGAGGAPSAGGERRSTSVLQLEKQNERLKEALWRLRDVTSETEAEQRRRIAELERELDSLSDLASAHDASQSRLKTAESQVEELKLQLDDALGAEEMLEQLTERNLYLSERIEDLSAAVEELELLKELADELEETHVETEKQLQEEVDLKDLHIRELRQRCASLEHNVADYEATFAQFRELVLALQQELESVRAQHEQSRGLAADGASQSQAMLDLSLKLQTSTLKSQALTLDLELGRLEAAQAVEHLAVVRPYLPASFFDGGDADAVAALLFFERLARKADILKSVLEQRHDVAGALAGVVPERLVDVCCLRQELARVAAVARQLWSIVRLAPVGVFLRAGALCRHQASAERMERTMDGFLDALRREELRETECTRELQRLAESLAELEARLAAPPAAVSAPGGGSDAAQVADEAGVVTDAQAQILSPPSSSPLGVDSDLAAKEVGSTTLLDHGLDTLAVALGHAKQALASAFNDADVEWQADEGRDVEAEVFEPLQRLLERAKAAKLPARKLLRRLASLSDADEAIRLEAVEALPALGRDCVRLVDFATQLDESVGSRLQELRVSKQAVRLDELLRLVRDGVRTSLGGGGGGGGGDDDGGAGADAAGEVVRVVRAEADGAAAGEDAEADAGEAASRGGDAGEARQAPLDEAADASSALAADPRGEELWATPTRAVASLDESVGALLQAATEQDNVVKISGTRPWFERVEQLRAEAAQNAEAERQAHKLAEGAKDLYRQIKARDQALQEAGVKVERLTRQVERLREQASSEGEARSRGEEAAKQAKAYQEMNESLQAELDALERQVEALKKSGAGAANDGAQTTAEAAAAAAEQAVGAVGAAATFVPGAAATGGVVGASFETAYLVEQLEALRGAVRLLRAENALLKRWRGSSGGGGDGLEPDDDDDWYATQSDEGVALDAAPEGFGGDADGDEGRGGGVGGGATNGGLPKKRALFAKPPTLAADVSAEAGAKVVASRGRALYWQLLRLRAQPRVVLLEGDAAAAREAPEAEPTKAETSLAAAVDANPSATMPPAATAEGTTLQESAASGATDGVHPTTTTTITSATTAAAATPTATSDEAAQPPRSARRAHAWRPQSRRPDHALLAQREARRRLAEQLEEAALAAAAATRTTTAAWTARRRWRTDAARGALGETPAALSSLPHGGAGGVGASMTAAPAG